MLILLLLCLFGPFINAQSSSILECWDCEANEDSTCSTTCKGYSCVTVSDISTGDIIKATCSNLTVENCTTEIQSGEQTCHCYKDKCNSLVNKKAKDIINSGSTLNYAYLELRSQNNNQAKIPYSSVSLLRRKKAAEEQTEEIQSQHVPNVFIFGTSENNGSEANSSSATSSTSNVSSTTPSTNNGTIFIFNEGSDSDTDKSETSIAGPSNSSHAPEDAVPVTKPWWEEDYDPTSVGSEEETIECEPVPAPADDLNNQPPPPPATDTEKTLEEADSVVDQVFVESKNPIIKHIFEGFNERNELLREKLRDMHHK